MKNISNNLILVLAILAFIFGLSLATPAYARTVRVDSGVMFDPFVNPVQYNPSYPVSNTNYYYTVPGCEGRNTGFSTTTGQSCANNYVNNTNSTNNTPTTTNTTNNTVSSTNNTSKVAKNTTSKTTDNSSKVVAEESDVNESYGGLTANALFGSNSFFPSGLVQWIILILIILAIIFLWRYVHAEDKYMSEPLKHA